MNQSKLGLKSPELENHQEKFNSRVSASSLSTISLDLLFLELREQLFPKYLPLTQRGEELLWGFLNQSYGVPVTLAQPDMTIFVNAQSNIFANGDVNNICGDIQWSPIEVCRRKNKMVMRCDLPKASKTVNLSHCRVLYDSGAFGEVRLNKRVTLPEALKRQKDQIKNLPAQPKETWIVSYDLLIDEKHINGDRIKRRWTVEEGKIAVRETVEAARYLVNKREQIRPNRLVLSCQGVDARQYIQCVKQILEFAEPQDVIGLGGWCILGKQVRWLPTFWETIQSVIPLIASAEIKNVHIFGVTWWKKKAGFPHTPLGSLLYLCDTYGISLTTDGRSPIGNALWKESSGNCKKKAGALHPYWRCNLAMIRTILGCLRDRPEYQPLPPLQLRLF